MVHHHPVHVFRSTIQCTCFHGLPSPCVLRTRTTFSNKHLPVSPLIFSPQILVTTKYTRLDICDANFLCSSYEGAHWRTSLFLCLISLTSQLSPVPAMLLQRMAFHSFYGWMVFYCVCAPQVLPLINSWAFKLFPFLSRGHENADGSDFVFKRHYAELLHLIESAPECTWH